MPGAFQRGWQFFVKTSQAGVSANVGQTYCKAVGDAIDTFSAEMYKMVEKHGDLGVGQCKGFVAEVWHAYTFNIDAALKGSNHKTSVDESTALGSVDVSSNFGRDFSMKYIGSAKKSAEAQAKNYYENYFEYLKKPRKGQAMSFEEYLQKNGLENNPEVLLKSVYSGQYRVIPSDQLEGTKERLRELIRHEIGAEGPNRAKVYQNYLETLEKLTDRIKDGEGVESIPLDKESAEVIVQLCRDGKFKAEDFGIDLANLVTTDYIVQQALKSGYTAAVMSLVLEVAPKVCEAIIYLIKNGEIDPDQLKDIGFAAVKGPALGFVRGYVSCALTIACQTGKLGKNFVKVPGDVIAAIVVLAMDTIKNAFLVAIGKMTGREMCMKTEDAAIVTVGALIGGAVGVALLPQLAIVGGLIGSFVGSVVGTLVAEGKNTLIMALCLNTGITLFGIVDQDYTLSKEMIESLGLKVVDLKINELNKNELNYNKPKMIELNKNELHTIDFFKLRRGVIGVRRIGYV